LLPSSVFTTIFAVPEATAVTSPFPFTVAAAVFVLLHVTLLLLALAGATAAVKLPALPPTNKASVCGATDTLVTSCLTVTTQVSVKLPSAVFTAIFATPTATAVTSPYPFTVAAAVFVLLHVTPLLLALAGATVAVKLPALPPTDKASVFGATDTPVTGCLTVTTQVSVKLPSAVFTTICATPVSTAVTKPRLLTVATASFVLLHVTLVSLALEGYTVGVSVVVPPTDKASVCATSTSATG
jgi:hypothetical protein